MVDSAAKIAAGSAARQAVRMGASEAAVGLVAALESSGAPALAQLVTKTWQGAAAFGAGYAIGYAGTYGYYAVKEVFNPKALPNPIEEMRRTLEARPYDPRSEDKSLNQCKGKLLGDYYPFFPVPYKKYDLKKALTTIKDGSCKNYSCEQEEMSQPEIFQRLIKGRQCYEARDALMRICHFGGDKNHRTEADKVLKAMQTCRDKIKLTP